ncbi:MAG TPA: purine-nucleoside phosphorylase [Trueperaceae bacterium]
MSQLHIHAEAGEVAPLVLLPGDPHRATYIAETFFETPRLYNDHRELRGYTGSYRGMPVSVQTTGMGCPSLAIVTEELVRLGAKTLIRVGTAGIVDNHIQPGELIVAVSSVPQDGTTRMYLQGRPYAPTASFEVTQALVRAGEMANRAVHAGIIQTEDAFYVTEPADLPKLRAQGVLAVEMESSALFTLGKLRKVRTGSVLVASNYIGDPQFVEPEVLLEGVRAMTSIALEAGRALEADSARG